MLLRYKDIEVGSFWCHQKTGNVYVVLFITNAEGDGTKKKYPISITYANISKQVWDNCLLGMPMDEREAKIDTHGSAEVKSWSGEYSDWGRRMVVLPPVGYQMAATQNRITHGLSQVFIALGGDMFNVVT